MTVRWSREKPFLEHCCPMQRDITYFGGYLQKHKM